MHQPVRVSTWIVLAVPAFLLLASGPAFSVVNADFVAQFIAGYTDDATSCDTNGDGICDYQDIFVLALSWERDDITRTPTPVAGTPTPTPTVPGTLTPTPTQSGALPDLASLSFSSGGNTVTEGGAYAISPKVSNEGLGPAGPSHVRLFLSIDNDYNLANDFEVLPEMALPALGPGEFNKPQWNFFFPNLSDDATYSVWPIIVVDSQNEIAETNENNVYKATVPITVTNAIIFTPTPTEAVTVTPTPTGLATDTPTPALTVTPTPTPTVASAPFDITDYFPLQSGDTWHYIGFEGGSTDDNFRWTVLADTQTIPGGPEAVRIRTDADEATDDRNLDEDFWVVDGSGNLQYYGFHKGQLTTASVDGVDIDIPVQDVFLTDPLKIGGNNQSIGDKVTDSAAGSMNVRVSGFPQTINGTFMSTVEFTAFQNRNTPLGVFTGVLRMTVTITVTANLPVVGTKTLTFRDSTFFLKKDIGMVAQDQVPDPNDAELQAIDEGSVNGNPVSASKASVARDP